MGLHVCWVRNHRLKDPHLMANHLKKTVRSNDDFAIHLFKFKKAKYMWQESLATAILPVFAGVAANHNGMFTTSDVYVVIRLHSLFQKRSEGNPQIFRHNLAMPHDDVTWRSTPCVLVLSLFIRVMFSLSYIQSNVYLRLCLTNGTTLIYRQFESCFVQTTIRVRQKLTTLDVQQDK